VLRIVVYSLFTCGLFKTTLSLVEIMWVLHGAVQPKSPRCSSSIPGLWIEKKRDTKAMCVSNEGWIPDTTVHFCQEVTCVWQVKSIQSWQRDTEFRSSVVRKLDTNDTEDIKKESADISKRNLTWKFECSVLHSKITCLCYAEVCLATQKPGKVVASDRGHVHPYYRDSQKMGCCQFQK
jgi:hypothetical protein